MDSMEWRPWVAFPKCLGKSKKKGKIGESNRNMESELSWKNPGFLSLQVSNFEIYMGFCWYRMLRLFIVRFHDDLKSKFHHSIIPRLSPFFTPSALRALANLQTFFNSSSWEEGCVRWPVHGGPIWEIFGKDQW